MTEAEQDATTLEITITHNLRELAEVEVLFGQRLIALDWGRLGSDPARYQGRAKTDVRLFHRMRTEGAAVIAAYKGATDRRSDRLVGYVEPGAEFRLDVNGLLCLPLARAKVLPWPTGAAPMHDPAVRHAGEGASRCARP